MTIFGQEVDFQVDPRTLGVIFSFIFVVIIIGGGVGMIFPKVMQYKSKITEREQKTEEKK